MMVTLAESEEKVTCPFCGAVPGNPCVTVDGGNLAAVHRSREQLLLAVSGRMSGVPGGGV